MDQQGAKDTLTLPDQFLILQKDDEAPAEAKKILSRRMTADNWQVVSLNRGVDLAGKDVSWEEATTMWTCDCCWREGAPGKRDMWLADQEHDGADICSECLSLAFATEDENATPLLASEGNKGEQSQTPMSDKSIITTTMDDIKDLIAGQDPGYFVRAQQEIDAQDEAKITGMCAIPVHEVPIMVISPSGDSSPMFNSAEISVDPTSHPSSPPTTSKIDTSGAHWFSSTFYLYEQDLESQWEELLDNVEFEIKFYDKEFQRESTDIRNQYDFLVVSDDADSEKRIKGRFDNPCPNVLALQLEDAPTRRVVVMWRDFTNEDLTLFSPFNKLISND